MAAIFYKPALNDNTLFKSGMQINMAVRIPFLDNVIGSRGFSVVNEVTINNRDTIQYFLTFDDLISYFYFGKGLGTISINGTMFSDCTGDFPGIGLFNSRIASVRGTKQNVSFGNAVFAAVISSFTVRASGEENLVEFNIIMDVVDHSLRPPRFSPAC